MLDCKSFYSYFKSHALNVSTELNITSWFDRKSFAFSFEVSFKILK